MEEENDDNGDSDDDDSIGSSDELSSTDVVHSSRDVWSQVCGSGDSFSWKKDLI